MRISSVMLNVTFVAKLYNESHVLFVWQINFFTLPKAIVYCKGIDGYSQMLGVHFGEALAARVIPGILN